MTSISVKTRVKADGTVQVAVPTGLPESDVDVLLLIQPINGGSAKGLDAWPEGFFEQTYGCMAEDPLPRIPDLPHEAREKLL